MMKRFNRLLSIAIMAVIILLSATIVACKKSSPDEKELALDKSSYSLTLLDAFSLTATLSGGLEGSVNWTVDDASILEITQSGASATVTGLMVGSATVKASVTVDSKTYEDECEVEVSMGTQRPRISMPSTNVDVPVGGTYTLMPTTLFGIKPVTSTSASYSYSSSNDSQQYQPQVL